MGKKKNDEKEEFVLTEEARIVPFQKKVDRFRV
jgi:hypothetical protein